ncbi:hypothetical protein, partial [Falsiroseomonas oryzae]|uniref:hypothetical protein n=1 Tax=Falsiroseomonas oryzae TaxID=2766473 RepID=UPI0022EA5510
ETDAAAWLDDLLPRLPEPVLLAAGAELARFESPRSSDALRRLAPHLSDAAAAGLVDRIARPSFPSLRGNQHALIGLGLGGSAATRAAVLRAHLSRYLMREEPDEVLAALAPHLPPELLRLAFEKTTEYSHHGRLRILAPLLEAAGLLDAACEWARTTVYAGEKMAVLAPALPPDRLRQELVAIAGSDSIWAVDALAGALSAWPGRLPDDLLAALLDAVRRNAATHRRAAMLAVIGGRLDAAQWPPLLDRVFEAGAEGYVLAGDLRGMLPALRAAGQLD